MVRLILDAGVHRFHGTERACVLVYEQDADGGERVALLRDEQPGNVPVIRIPLDSFLELKRQHGLGFRVLMSADERQRRAKESHERYRASAKYRTTRSARELRSRTQREALSREALHDIRSGVLRQRTYARRYHLSLRDVAQIQAEAADDE